MRSSLAVALAFTLGLGACTPALCGRNSDCPSGQLCTAAGTCAVPADAGGDGAPGDAAATAVRTGTMDAERAAEPAEADRTRVGGAIIGAAIEGGP
jgi:hypothetical protein